MNKYEQAYQNIQVELPTNNKDILVLRELVELANPKKPDYEGDGYDEEVEIIYDTWICPNCGKRYEVDYDEYDYCPNCGQKLELKR